MTHMNSQLSRRELIWMLFGPGLLRAGALQSEKQRCLYLLAGGIWPVGEWKFACSLFRLDESGAKVEWATTLVSRTAGLDTVLYSFENRLLLVAGPEAVKSNWVLVRFDEPGSPESFLIDPGPAVVLAPRLVYMDGDLWLTLKLSAGDTQRLLAVRLRDLETKEVPPEVAYQEFAIDGAPGGSYPRSEFASLEQPASSRRLVIAEWIPPRFNSPIVLPDNITFSPNDRISLAAANGDLLVLTSRETGVWKGSEGYMPVWLFDRRRRNWHSIQVPGAISRLRAFGEWLNVNVTYNLIERPKRGEPVVRDGSFVITPSPGAEQRRQGLSETGPGFDAYATDLQILQPGLIYLYHVPSRRRIVEETGQGDTEVLWIEAGKVLYRCDRALYEARIEGTSLRDRRKLIERDFIADVHWVFYGPPSPPPPDPPWKAFEDY